MRLFLLLATFFTLLSCTGQKEQKEAKISVFAVHIKRISHSLKLLQKLDKWAMLAPMFTLTRKMPSMCLTV